MKKIIILVSILLIVMGGAFTYFLRFPPWQLGSALSVATGLSAKTACSHFFISKFSQQQIMSDLATYSPATGLVELHIDEANQSVSAEIFGMRKITAKYRKGLGCSFENEQSKQLDLVITKAVDEQPLPWPQGNQVNTVAPNMQQRVEQVLQIDNAAGQDTRALLVVKSGDVLAEAYAESYDADTMFLGWSMGKSITALLIGQLEAESKLKVNETDLFDVWQKDERKNISIHHLLTMTGGLDFDETYTPGSDSTYMLFGAPSVADVALRSDKTYDPGLHFYYSSGTSNLLSQLVFERAGNSAQANYDFFHSRMLMPLGLTHTIFEPDSTGVFVGSSYIYASARDWAKLGYLVVNGGVFNEQELLSKDFVQRMSQPNTSLNDPRYGYQLWLNAGGDTLRWPKLPSDAFAMQGNRGQVVLMIPSLELVIVRLGWSPSWYSLEDSLNPLVEEAKNK